MLFLSDADVRLALPPLEAIAANEAAFVALDDGSATCPERQFVATAGGPTIFKPVQRAA